MGQTKNLLHSYLESMGQAEVWMSSQLAPTAELVSFSSGLGEEIVID